MTLAFADYAVMFIGSFVLVFLLGIQSRNVVAGRYLAAVATSFGISVSNFIFVKYAATGSLDVFFVNAAGGCLGIAGSIFFYKHIIERKRHG
jgi:K+-sensing histidine kinase KdpD